MVKEYGVDLAYNLDEKNKEKVKELSFDRLTGLPGGELLISKLEELIEKLNSKENIPKKIIVIALDMNKLKFFNDTFGHIKGGDKALKTFADHLRMVIKDVDLIFRPNKGGDEFTILLKISKEDVDSGPIFERIRKAVNAGLSVDFGGQVFPITASMGYVEVKKGDSDTVETILHKADLEMYKDKDKTRQMENEDRESGLEDYSI